MTRADKDALVATMLAHLQADVARLQEAAARADLAGVRRVAGHLQVEVSLNRSLLTPPGTCPRPTVA